ncbi:XRE family transcriptional regulator [Streptomyces sp. NPDC021093]|uniref:XRE family transcriptional regulator n=1 Tax=Streptomyces sp. NPDC021093 TaxID=3365112 RepID=UPI00379DE1BE
MHGINQSELGALLGYDKTMVSAMELGKRPLNDTSARRHVAERLRIPPHVLGVTDPADADHRAMLQFGQSAVRLAEIARQAGHASEAVAELWPLVARLEARVEDGHAERDVLHLLAEARVGLGVALGNVLPEERLPTAASWTGRSLTIARYFDDPAFTSQVLRMHGNELRKAHLTGAAVHRLHQAAALAPDDTARAAVLPLLARAAGALHDGTLFDSAVRETEQLLEHTEHTSLFNPFALHEIRLRGLVATGRADAAIRLVDHTPDAMGTGAQWAVIARITSARVRLLGGDRTGAADALAMALGEAVRQRLPHQLQRIIRATAGRLPDVRDTAGAALDGMRREMAA